MRYTRSMGIAVPEHHWVPSPMYILRRAAILDWLKAYQPGRVLEMGCGPGALLYELMRLGFTGAGVELSNNSRRIAEHIFSDVSNFPILGSPPSEQEQPFDYLFAFEVLEHIEEDRVALIEWLNYLKPGGVVFVSVPAHKSHWNVTDIAAGHYRRYDRDDVLKLIKGAGLEVERIGTYGWPVSRVIETIRAWIKTWSLARQGVDPAGIQPGDSDMTAASGADRRLETRLYPIYSSSIGRAFFRLATLVQRLFYNSSLGVSFLVIARKPI